MYFTYFIVSSKVSHILLLLVFKFLTELMIANIVFKCAKP